MYFATRHAIYSLCRPKHRGNSHNYVFSFLEWKDDCYASLCRKFPHMCKFLALYHQTNSRMTVLMCQAPWRLIHVARGVQPGALWLFGVRYAEVPFWNNIQTPLPKHTWDTSLPCGIKKAETVSMQCLQQKLAKRAYQRNSWGKVRNSEHT